MPSSFLPAGRPWVVRDIATLPPGSPPTILQMGKLRSGELKGHAEDRSPDLCVKPYTPGGAAQRTAGELLGWTQFTLLTHGIVSKEKDVCVASTEVWSDFPRRSR